MISLAGSDAHDVRARIYDDAILEWYRYPPGPAGTVPSHSHEEYQLSLCFGSASRYRYRGGWIVVPSGHPERPDAWRGGIQPPKRKTVRR